MKIITNFKQNAFYKFISGNDYDITGYYVIGYDKKIERDDLIEVEEFIIRHTCKLDIELRRFRCPGCAKIVGIITPQCFKYRYRYGLIEVKVN